MNVFLNYRWSDKIKIEVLKTNIPFSTNLQKSMNKYFLKVKIKKSLNTFENDSSGLNQFFQL